MRIIAGSARGRRFDAPEGRNTRPTLDRVKEAMFGMIQFDIENTQVLDLFSGSGIVARFLKQHSEELIVNDLEESSRVVNTCYLSNAEEATKNQYR